MVVRNYPSPRRTSSSLTNTVSSPCGRLLFLAYRSASQKLARISKPQLASVMPARNEIQVSLRSSIRLPDVEGLLVDVLASLAAVTYSRAPASPSADEPRGSVCVDARVNSWTRSFRRQGQHHPIDTEVPPIIRCRISWWPDVASEQVIAQCGWVEGRDRRLFESFWSHVSRKAFNPTQ